MTSPIAFTTASSDGTARAGVLSTGRGQVRTPSFMPVGTRAAVKAVDTDDLKAVGTEMVLANTYHLMLRPGADVVAGLGGLHTFMSWEGPILTDSGGFQIFSLDPRIEESGATFRSAYDGSQVALSPEDAALVQEKLGADIAMVLDVCVGLPAERGIVTAAMERTLRWSERFLSARRQADQAVFGIVQGGVDTDLRAESASRTAQLEVDGFGIGGLSVGELPEDRDAALQASIAALPPDKVRYVMGLGDPEGVLEAIGRGADLFDCVWPTRLARHGRALAGTGDLNLRHARHSTSPEPIEDGCPCRTCQSYSRGYLRHLVSTHELSAHRLLTIHNLTFTFRLLRNARLAIERGEFEGFKLAFAGGRSAP